MTVVWMCMFLETLHYVYIISPFKYSFRSHCSNIFINEFAHIIIWSIFGASLTHSKQWACGEPLIWNSILITQSVMWPRGCASFNKYCDKNDWSLHWNMCTPVIGFCQRYKLLCVILIFRTSSLDSLLPSCSATASIISDQCKSAADSVKNHVGMPKECSIPNKSYSSCYLYAGDPLMFFKNLYACSVHTRYWSAVGFCNIPAVIFCLSWVLPQDKWIAR